MERQIITDAELAWNLSLSQDQNFSDHQLARQIQQEEVKNQKKKDRKKRSFSIHWGAGVLAQKQIASIII